MEKVKVVPVIGLEVHAQLDTESKMFCPCPTTFAAEPNSATCPVCLGFPGTLPVVNREAVTLAIRFGLAVGGEIDSRSGFARKNYFYPDLPKGYQITQFDRPIVHGGTIEIESERGPREIRLVRAHLEEDAGKSLHDSPYPDVPDTVTLVEWNRAGVPLLEIVSEPDLRSSSEAMAYLTEMRRLLRTLSISEANMEEGNLRCDANVSVRRSESDPYGTRVEIKNMNSIRNVGRAIEFEIARQAGCLASGDRVIQETRLFDVGSGETRVMRSKEEAHDYRYLAEPDLGSLDVPDAWIAQVRSSLRETPREKRRRFLTVYALSAADADLLSSARALAEYFEKVAAIVAPRLAASWVTGEVLRWMKEQKVSPEDAGRFSVSPAELGDLIGFVGSGAISTSAAKTVFEEMARTGLSAQEIIRERNLGRVSDEAVLAEAIESVLRDNPGPVGQYRAGKVATLGFLVGCAMKATGGRADPETVRRLLRGRLDA